MYFDTSYIAKFYFNEPQSAKIRELVRGADSIYSSLWAFAEFHAVLHRHMREGVLAGNEVRDLAASFCEHVAEGLWKLIPVNEALIRKTSTLILAAPPDLFIRTADAIHLATAQETGQLEVWTNDRHMLAAAAYFGLMGRCV